MEFIRIYFKIYKYFLKYFLECRVGLHVHAVDMCGEPRRILSS